MSVDRENVIVSAIKRAEDGDGVIVRAYETEGTATTATIHLPAFGRTIATRFNPCEIKTFKLPDDLSLEVSEVNLIEW